MDNLVLDGVVMVEEGTLMKDLIAESAVLPICINL